MPETNNDINKMTEVEIFNRLIECIEADMKAEKNGENCEDNMR